MIFPSEYRIFVELPKNKLDIINNYVVNIKKSNKKGDKNMLEHEKAFRLEQLNALKSIYVARLDELNEVNIDALVEDALALKREEMRNKFSADHEANVSKTEFQIEAVNDMIADVETEETEIAEELIVEEATEETEATEAVEDVAVEN